LASDSENEFQLLRQLHRDSEKSHNLMEEALLVVVKKCEGRCLVSF